MTCKQMLVKCHNFPLLKFPLCSTITIVKIVVFTIVNAINHEYYHNSCLSIHKCHDYSIWLSSIAHGLVSKCAIDQ